MKRNWTLLLLLPLFFFACKKDPVEPTPDSKSPFIANLFFRGDTLVIQGRVGPAPTAMRRVIVNEETVPEDKIVEWKEEEVQVIVEAPLPEEKTVQVEVAQKKSNFKKITKAAAGSNPLRVDYLQVAEPSGRLYIHGQFGADPGPGRRAITVEQVTNRLIRTPITNIQSWNNNVIVCTIPNTGAGSHGKVIVRVDADSASRGLYQFNFVASFNRPQGGASGSLAEQIRFYIWYRGDGEVAPASVQPFNLSASLHDESKAVWEGSGEGRSSYNNIDGCASIFVQWQKATGVVYIQPESGPMLNTNWRATVVHKRDGFDVKMHFSAYNAISSTITTSPCTGNSIVQQRPESIFFDEFEFEPIHFKVSGEYLAAGEMTRSGLSSTAGLHWDASEFQQQLVTARLSWNRTQGKLD